MRPSALDPSLPTVGTGQYEWHGLPRQRPAHPGHRPQRRGTGRWSTGTTSPPTGSAPRTTTWGGNGSVARVDLLNRDLKLLEDTNGKWTLARVTSAMNAAATQDVRAIDTVPLLAKLLKGIRRPTRRPRRCCDLLVAWRQHGGSRLDLNLDGQIDDPGAAIMDAAWPKIADAFMKPQLGPQLNELELAVLALRPAAGRPVQRLVPVLRPRHPAGCSAMQVSRSRSQNRYCGAGN